MNRERQHFRCGTGQSNRTLKITTLPMLDGGVYLPHRCVVGTGLDVMRVADCVFLTLDACTKQAVKTINYLPCGIGTLTSVNNQPLVTALCYLTDPREAHLIGRTLCDQAHNERRQRGEGNTDWLAVGRYRPAMAVSIPELIAVNACSR
ncbi:hypothetical protein Q2941_02130 [Bradyrhizobium sp. UFLA05-153]